MSNVIEFPAEFKDTDGLGYIVDENSIFGVRCNGIELTAEDNTKNGFILRYSGESVSREDLARFLWAAAYFLDSDQEWDDSDYIGLNK